MLKAYGLVLMACLMPWPGNAADNSSEIEFHVRPFCLCDLKANECEVDCCCDEDCENEDIESFFECLNSSQPFDSSMYCGSSSGLFCLVQCHEFPSEYELYKNKAPITNLLQFDAILHRHNRRMHSPLPRKQNNDHYEPGKLLIAKYDTGLGGIYLLPDLPLIYMSKNEVPFFHGVYNASFLPREVLVHPNDSEISVRISWSLCSIHEDHMDCMDTEPLNEVSPSVYSSLNVEILHQGLFGIKEVTVLLKKRPERSQTGFHVLTLGYYHRLWRNESSNGTLIRKRSGNPGYIVGKPVVLSLSEVNSTSRKLENGLEYYGFFPSGNCDDPNRRKMSLLFGENVRSGCELDVYKSNCSNVYQRMSKIYAFNLNDLRIGAFGNTEVQDRGEDDWINIFSVNNFNSLEFEEDECLLPRSLSIEVLTSNTGSFSDPQKKIIGAIFRYTIPEEVPRNAPRIPIYISTSFIDVSEPAVALFSEFPVLEARFPRDFFYPFFISYSARIHQSFILCLTCLFYLIVF